MHNPKQGWLLLTKTQGGKAGAEDLTTEKAETRMRAARKRFEKESLRASQPPLFRGLSNNRENGD